MSRTKLVVLFSSIAALVVAAAVAFAVTGDDDAPTPEVSEAPLPESPEPEADHVEASPRPTSVPRTPRIPPRPT